MTHSTPDGPPQPVAEAAFPPLTQIDLGRTAAAVTEVYRNFVVQEIDDFVLRMAVMQGEYRWHRHPRAAECFLVLEGCFEIDLPGGRTVKLLPGQAFTVPKGEVHRTRARERAVNLCFEHRDAYTDVEFLDDFAG